MTETLVLHSFILFFLLSPTEVIPSPPSVTTDKNVTNSTTTSSPLTSISSIKPPPDAALLVHVYDLHSNLRHHHHNHPWGPHFEENPINITVQEGQNIWMDCRVGLIEDKMVSWVRRKSDQLDLLTLGTTNHSSDPRISSDFKYPNNWRLAIRNASRNDSSTYLCQISTHPPKVLEVQLTVEAPEVFITNARGEMINEIHYKEGSTLNLTCSVNNLKSKSVNWFRNKDLLNHDVSRGGVSIKTDMTTDHAKSILNVALVRRNDGGTYLCSAPPLNASIIVHVLNNGENPAELYHNVAPRSSRLLLSSSIFNTLNLLVIFTFYLLFLYMSKLCVI